MADAQSNHYLHGSPILLGDNTIPGVAIPDAMRALLPDVFQEVTNLGCDYFDTVVQMLTYDEISEIAAYGGFPVRYPHWSFGAEYEELQRGYQYGQHRIYEMVINSKPLLIYCLDSNTLVDNITVVAHALGHGDFFRNNVFFEHTDTDMVNRMANHSNRIQRYMSEWGKDRVTRFIDHVRRIETLVDPTTAGRPRKPQTTVKSNRRQYLDTHRINVSEGHEHLENFVNDPAWLRKQRARLDDQEMRVELELFAGATKDVLGHIRDHAPLRPWQQDIVSMLHAESQYFAPQRRTKMLNEGWASFVDHKIMVDRGLLMKCQEADSGGIIEYAKHKAGVLGGKYSMNPYKIGYCLMNDIEERWNKGRFGEAYDNCKDLAQREAWDTKAGLGLEKVFEVRRHHCDLTAIHEYFTDEFCHKHQFYFWNLQPNGQYVCESTDPKVIRRKLMQKYANGGLPDVQLVDPNYGGKGRMLLEVKNQDGREVYEGYLLPVLQSLRYLWGNDVHISCHDKDGQEVVYTAFDVDVEPIKLTRAEHDKQFR